MIRTRTFGLSVRGAPFQQVVRSYECSGLIQRTFHENNEIQLRKYVTVFINRKSNPCLTGEAREEISHSVQRYIVIRTC